MVSASGYDSEIEKGSARFPEEADIRFRLAAQKELLIVGLPLLTLHTGAGEAATNGVRRGDSERRLSGADEVDAARRGYMSGEDGYVAMRELSRVGSRPAWGQPIHRSPSNNRCASLLSQKSSDLQMRLSEYI